MPQKASEAALADFFGRMLDHTTMSYFMPHPDGGQPPPRIHLVLLACPVCKGKELDIDHDPGCGGMAERPATAKVVCNTCKISGPVVSEYEETMVKDGAVSRWNQLPRTEEV